MLLEDLWDVLEMKLFRVTDGAFVESCTKLDLRVDQLVKGRRATPPLSFETANKVPTAKNAQQVPQQRRGVMISNKKLFFSHFLSIFFFKYRNKPFFQAIPVVLLHTDFFSISSFFLPSFSQTAETPRRLGPRFPSPGKTWSAVTFWFLAMAPRMEGEWRGRRGWGGMEAWMPERCQISAFFCWMVWEKSDIFLSSGDSLQPCHNFSCQKSLTEIAKLTLETGIT